MECLIAVEIILIAENEKKKTEFFDNSYEVNSIKLNK